MMPELNPAQWTKMKSAPGFIAALDQSGGSTPHALESYGLAPGSWSSDKEMFDLVHQMRSRIMTSPSFTGDRILAAILFEDTMNRQVAGEPTADYLWNRKQIVPFLKVDQGLANESQGVRMMKPMPGLPELLQRARANRIFGTKMRSVILQADPVGIENIAAQQFEFANQIWSAGLVPIVEPEVDIHCPDKSRAEDLLKTALRARLDRLPSGQSVMLKLTLPTQDNLYREFVTHPQVLRVVALSGGYSQAEANTLLQRNHGVVASFSRALAEGLTAGQTDAQFNATLDASIGKIYAASIT